MLKDQLEVAAIAARVRPLPAGAARRLKQAALLIEADRARRHAQLARQVADAEGGLVGLRRMQ